MEICMIFHYHLPFDVICIRKINEFSDIVFIFNIITLIGGTINGNIAEYKSEK